MINEDIKEKNLSLFFKKISELDIDPNIFNEFRDKLKNAPFTNTNDLGLAYEGSFLNVILRILTPYALKINESLPNEIKVDKKSLIKVCLLSQIAKCDMFEPNDNEWEKDKRGIIFKYKKTNFSLKNGIRSLLFSSNLGITFTNEEAEAMIVMDRTFDDEQAKYFSNQMAVILRQANELTYLQTRLMK